MDSKLLITVATALALLSTISMVSTDSHVSEMQSQWSAWKSLHNKSYGSSEEAFRFAVFCDNAAWVNQFNSEGHTSTVAINQFSDLTRAEFKAIYANGFQPSTVQLPLYQSPRGFTAPESVNWLTKGAVTDVKNQGQCGSCWAFGTVGGIEGGYQVAGNPLTSFSEQQICSCDTSDDGCGGGNLGPAYEYVNGAGLDTDAEYPYTSGGGVTGQCQQQGKTVTIQAGAVSGQAVGTNSKTDFINALAKQPLSICIDASSSVFSGYSGGVITTGCGTSIDHCVTAVAYDLSASTPYVTIKNSWGTSYGVNGYVKVGVQADGEDGVCGIYSGPYLAIF